MNRYFLDAAQSEFDDAIDNYDEQRFGLGLEFEKEVDKPWNVSITILKPVTTIVAGTPLRPESISLQRDL